MNTIVFIINAALTALFNLLLWPFKALHPIWALLLVSLVAGVVMLWLFGKTSNQTEIHRIRDWIRGNLIGIRLFGDDLGMLFRLQTRILRATMTYMRHALVPLVIMMGPVVLILIQLDLRFTVKPLEPGESTVVKVTLRDGSATGAAVSLETPEGVTIETPPVRVEESGEIAWRVRADTPGRHTLRIVAEGETIEKDLVVGGGWTAVSKQRTGSFFGAFMHPGEKPLGGSSAVRSVAVQYEALPLSVFGWGLNWLLVFFVASIVFGFAFKKPLGVEI